MEEIPTIHKREREDSDELLISPEQKRLRSDLILDIFDDENDAGSEDDLASVMKSLEEEIGLPSPTDPPPSELPLDSGDAQQPDLGYLFEASDDELGLPPTVASSEEDGVVEVSHRAEVDAGFGQIWGFADELPECYDGFEYSAFRPDESDSVAGDDVGVLGGDLFGYADEFYPPTDLNDLSWRSEYLPAV